jgi:hypothetical protein
MLWFYLKIQHFVLVENFEANIGVNFHFDFLKIIFFKFDF